jgi:hypothetical protein
VNTQDVLDALTRFGTTEQDTSEPPTCFGCGDEYTFIDDKLEATAFCDPCAHEAVDVLANEVEMLRANLANYKEGYAREESGVIALRGQVAVLNARLSELETKGGDK